MRQSLPSSPRGCGPTAPVHSKRYDRTNSIQTCPNTAVIYHVRCMNIEEVHCENGLTKRSSILDMMRTDVATLFLTSIQVTGKPQS